jgi:anti-sigma factor RsiW
MAHSPYDMMISLSLDGQLSPDEERDLRQHLQTCDTCASAWRRMTLLDAMFSHPVNAPAPVDLTARVMAHVESYEARRRWYPWVLGVFIVSTIAAALSIAAPILLFSLGLYQTILSLPVIGTLLGFVLRSLDAVRSGVLFAVSALSDWLTYLLADPASLAIVLTALVLASTLIGLLEGIKAISATESSAQQA